ncbi:Ubiquitin carboxyl-terminal hydrolase [Taphrina deformans PYCC 5710]|uniref:Ubiquitin carboxyl-terminal hydrolase n=1 Tax=Taphrina deformans (strain PYCC 5710 / ATCC 11124 / CBS 356.35 / IMI 108563 / JCM 9778 / NBRC 8474) TaxID=1097556 RepID=R4X8U6_TAPDE|nr:Ubiquitin carboxyl-terminal hydrolase [Taphrina deformans PYCC 5710]|eukprot:CCG81850.1 Ubiquitin carboxyl-terminal hydrolase [Taphrina deformans PYCC 5710]
MTVIPVTIKWAGQKPFEVEVDTEESGATLKMQIYSITGVETDRQKLLVKGGALKDDQDMSKLGLKPKQTLMLMGSASELPQAPTQKIVFMEDMDESELAMASKSPPGLQNLGNTCYMNSTLQLLRAIPELQTELGNFSGANLTGSLRDLYKSMDKTSESFPPAMFLQALRNVYPQFAQQSRSGMGFAQQDAEECWSQIIYTLRQNLKASTGSVSGAESSLDTFMSGRMKTIMTCAESDAEPVVETQEPFVKLNCHIGSTTNYMIDGIRDSLTDQIEKHSDVLDRNATFIKKSSVSRLPKYLNVNFVRFFFKTGIQKKAKILRKVGFPFELDATELCTDDLRQKIAPIRDRVRELQKAEEDAERARKRTKTQLTDEGASSSEISAKMDTMGASSDKPDLQKEVDSLLTEEMKNDTGANNCGLYELIGVLTHSGASADSGHYQAWMKAPMGDDWYRFNDDKVTVVSKEKIEGLAGGGESDSIYIGLYKSKF